MMDEIFDRTYQAGRADLNTGIGRGLNRLGATLGKSLAVLHRIEWSTPWRSHPRDVGHA